MLLGVLLQAAVALATDDCADMDLRSAGNSLEGIGAMSQGEHGICYAYAAAQMADAWTNAHRTPRTADTLNSMHRVSPASLAVNSKAAGFGTSSGGTKNTPGCVKTAATGLPPACSVTAPINGGFTEDCINYLRSANGTACDHRSIFGESSVSYSVIAPNPRKTVFDPLDPNFSLTEPDNIASPVVRTGLGMGGTFSTGRGSQGGTDMGQHFNGRDSDYLTLVARSWDRYQAALQVSGAVPSQVAGQMSQELTTCLLELGMPASKLVGTLSGGTNEALQRIFQESQGGNKLQFLNRYFGALCQAPAAFRVSPALPAIHVQKFLPEDGNHDNAAIVRYVNQKLGGSGGMPVAFSYCASVLRGPHAFGGLTSAPVEITSGTGAGESGRCRAGSATSSTGVENHAHASLIIGRKRVGGQCRFLVRNSWGASCERYVSDSPGYQCEPATGDIWVDATTLASSLWAVEHFE